MDYCGLFVTGDTPEEKRSYRNIGCTSCGTRVSLKGFELTGWAYLMEDELNYCKVCGKPDPAHDRGCMLSVHSKCYRNLNVTIKNEATVKEIDIFKEENAVVINWVSTGLRWVVFFVVLFWTLGVLKIYINYRFVSGVSERISPVAEGLIDKIGDQFVKGTNNLRQELKEGKECLKNTLRKYE